MTRRRPGQEQWVLIPLVFVVWSNLHGSFVVGLALLAGLAAGRGADIVRRTGSLRAVWSDDRSRRAGLLLLLGAGAALANPYGFGAYRAVFTIATNPNLAISSNGGRSTFGCGRDRRRPLSRLALVVFYRVTPRRVSIGEFLLLAGLGGAALKTSRMVVWCGADRRVLRGAPRAAVWNRDATPGVLSDKPSRAGRSGLPRPRWFFCSASARTQRPSFSGGRRSAPGSFAQDPN